MVIPCVSGTEDLKLEGITMNEERFLTVLANIIGQAGTVQNDPSLGLIPREDNVGDAVLETLKPFTKEEGGPLIVERVHFTPGRGNIIIRYPGEGPETVSFVGSHMDVVPANPEDWTVDPFKLTRDSKDADILYGRGTTDCLGHVALLTDLFCSLAELKPKLQHSVNTVLIVNEENQIVQGIGADGLDECGKLDEIGMKNGPVLWVDVGGTGVGVGSTGAISWSIKAHGKTFHSGFPNMVFLFHDVMHSPARPEPNLSSHCILAMKSINPIELVSEAMAVIQRRFYEKFPSHPLEAEYYFDKGPTMKPVQIKCARGSLNQIPGDATMIGDIRLTPFYSIKEVKEAVEGFVRDLNADISKLPTRGHSSKYILPDGSKGTLELEWITEGMDGIACDLQGKGVRVLTAAMKSVTGTPNILTISGSLPLVRGLKDRGYDIVLTGFGLSSKFHAVDECCKLSDMSRATRILVAFLCHMETHH